MFDQSFANRSVAWPSIGKTVYSSIFSPSVNLCLYVFLTSLLTMSVLVTLYLCSQLRVNGGRYIDLLRSRCAELRAAFASFNCILHNQFMLWEWSTQCHRRSGELNTNIVPACFINGSNEDMDELIGTLPFNICTSTKLTGVKHSFVLSVFICIHTTVAYLRYRQITSASLRHLLAKFPSKQHLSLLQ